MVIRLNTVAPVMTSYGVFVIEILFLVDCIRTIRIVCIVSFQGIVGNDQRHYVLDLLRTFPPDVNYMPGIYFIYPDSTCSLPFNPCPAEPGYVLPLQTV